MTQSPDRDLMVRLAGPRSTRRGALMALAGTGLGLALPAGWRQAEAQPAGSTIRMTESTLGEADPHKPTDVPSSILMFNLYDFLIRPAPGGGVSPSLATSWEVSGDGLTYTFALRDDVRFHDGKPFTSEDVVFSLRRMQTMRRGFAGLFEVIRSAEALGPHRVRFVLARNYAPFLASFARLAIVNSVLVRANQAAGTFGEFGDYGQAFLSAKDGGSGPYVLTRHEAQQETVMTKFAGHFMGHDPRAAETVRLRFGLQPPTVRTMMTRRELELTRVSLPPEILVALARTPGISLGQDRAGSMFQFKLNMRRAPTDDVEVRRAISLAFDYAGQAALLDVAGVAAGIPSRGPIPSGVMGYDEAAPTGRRNLDAAKAALARSKYGANVPPLDLIFVREFAQVERYALLFQRSMADIGLRVNVLPIPWAQYQQTITTAESTPNVCCIYVGLTTPDVDSLLWTSYHSTSPATYFSAQWMNDPEVDRGLEAGRTILNTEQRAAHYRALGKRIADLVPAVFCYDQINVIARQNYVSAPTLTDMRTSVPLLGGNYQFRTMGVGAPS
ncbi:MAG: ABC transporter substrate-binding protein [Alphaproteobacteria bacterium]|nr:ABC transporter substrate-binding protein [Alphaproteobacteria bacterium]